MNYQLSEFKSWLAQQTNYALLPDWETIYQQLGAEFTKENLTNLSNYPDYQAIIEEWINSLTKPSILSRMIGAFPKTPSLRRVKSTDNLTKIPEESKQVKSLKLLAEKRKKELEQEKSALIALARQKKQLQNNWKEEKEQLQTEIDEANIALLHQQKLASKASKNKQEINGDYERLETENERLTTENEQLTQTLTNLQGTDLGQQNHTLIKQNDQLTNQNQVLTTKNKQLVQSLNSSKEENNALIRENNNLTKQKQALLTESEQLNVSLNNLAKENKDLAQQNTNLLQEVLVLNTLLNQNQSATNSPLSEWLKEHGGELLLLGGVASVGYLLVKE